VKVQLLMLVAISITAPVMRVAGRGAQFSDMRVLALWHSDAAMLLLSAAAYAFTGILIYRLLSQRSGSGFLLQLPFMVLLAGVIVLQSLTQGYSALPSFKAYALALEALSQLVFCMTTISIMRSLPISSFTVMGFATILTSLPSFLHLALPDDAVASVYLIILGLAYVIALAIVILVKDTADADRAEADAHASGRGEHDKALQDADALDARIIKVADMGGLTSREREIFSMLVRGKNLPAIQRELFIAPGTARTHIKHIYEKLGVHTRQELLGLFL
jgi:DNA-binding CsgD family transcriptional regulator